VTNVALEVETVKHYVSDMELYSHA